MHIRIISTPPGDAPEEIRRAWVGMILPIVPGDSGPVLLQIHSIFANATQPLTRLKSILAAKWQRRSYRGYRVLSQTAIELLEQSQPQAAQWWRENTPLLLQAGKMFIFEEHACVLIPTP